MVADVNFSQAISAYGKALKNPGETVGDSGASTGGLSAFGQMVSDSLEQAANQTRQTEAVSSKAIVNKAELTDLVTSVANTELALNTVVAVRDRVINAYQEIIKMPI